MAPTFNFLDILSKADKAEPRRQGETIFELGERGEQLYVIKSGTAQIKIGDMVFETVGAGGVIGEMALLDDEVRSAGAFALSDCEVVPINKARLLQLVRKQPDVAIALAGLVAHRLRTMNYLARHDALTTLPNRVLFQERCRTAIARAHRRAGALGVLFVDIDKFKTVNESFGYASGDLLLKEVSARLQGALHELDTLSRLSADEFAVLLEDIANGHELAVASRRLLDALAEPVTVSGQNIYVSASIGISCYPQDGEDGESLLNNADTAMRRAKDQGGNGYTFFSQDLSTLALESLTLKNFLREALVKNEFYLNYQPRVDAGSGAVSGVEALIRWKHPELGFIPPGKFIPIAEQTGMIDTIGDWVLRTACAQHRIWQDAGLASFRIAVNLSGRQLRQPNLKHRIVEILNAAALGPNRLELEITESVLMEDTARTVFVLKELRALGVTIALDDFGTEYSSLGYLRQFPLDYIKIDQSFVRGLPADADHVAIVKAVITLASDLGVKIIAEGVETDEQRAFLQSNGCTEMQGYLFSRPIEAASMEAFAKAHAKENF